MTNQWCGLCQTYHPPHEPPADAERGAQRALSRLQSIDAEYDRAMVALEKLPIAHGLLKRLEWEPNADRVLACRICGGLFPRHEAYCDLGQYLTGPAAMVVQEIGARQLVLVDLLAAWGAEANGEEWDRRWEGVLERVRALVGKEG